MQSRAPVSFPGEQPLKIVPVAGDRLVNNFIRIPWSVYSSDSCWVPPLILERKWHFSKKNPYFDHAEFQAWIACRGEQMVGRISAQIDRLHQQRYQDATGFFGLLEGEDQADTFQALFETAEAWLRQRGMKRIRGPFNLSINDECGLLVDGFGTPPPIMLGHARPYYGPRVEEQGYVGIQDLLAYRVQPDIPSPPQVEALSKRFSERIRIRTMRRNRFQEELEIIRSIFEDAWAENWGFIPFTPEEFAELGKNLKFLVDAESVRIAEVDGEPAAMMIMFPNLNEAIRDLNGHLFPLGWLKLLWRLKVAGLKTARIPLMGVKRRFQGGLLGAALVYMMIAPLHVLSRRRGLVEVDMSWILEQNRKMCKIIESAGGSLYKRYRIYQKDLSPP